MGKVWLLTASSRGSGRFIAEAVLDAGDSVVAAARNMSKLQDLVAKFGRLDVLVNVTKAAIPVMRRQRGGRILQVPSFGARISSGGLVAYQSSKWAVSGFAVALPAELCPFNIFVSALEPGSMLTEFSHSAAFNPATEEYRAAVQPQIGVLAASAPMRSKPEDVARTVVHVANLPEPPVRLLLGADVVDYAKTVNGNLAAADEQWKDVTMLKVYMYLGVSRPVTENVQLILGIYTFQSRQLRPNKSICSLPATKPFQLWPSSTWGLPFPT